MRRLLLSGCLALAGSVFSFTVVPARADVPVPPLKARVTDLTGTLNAQQTRELESRIAAFESKRGSQIAVLLLPTTKPEEIEQYSIRVAEAWKIGRKKVDDGLLLIVAKDDRRLRIEVGYGLEGAIPDSMAKRVIDERITPRFRDGDFYGGVRDGVDQLIQLAEGEKLPPPSATQGPASGSDNIAGFFFLAFGYLLVGGYFMKELFGRLPGSIVGGGLIGAIAWIAFGAAFGVAAFVIAFLATFVNTGVGRGGGRSSGGGSWSSGSSGGSSSSWGGGGGGSFGGGGSSGSW